MSRKRQQKKARDKELARQMQGVVTKDGVTQDQLKEQGRVTEFRHKPLSLTVTAGKRGLLKKAQTVVVQVVFFLVERHQTRQVAHLQLVTTLPKAPADDVAFDVIVDEVVHKKLAYARPAHFVGVAYIDGVDDVGLPVRLYVGDGHDTDALHDVDWPGVDDAIDVDVDLDGGRRRRGHLRHFAGIHRTKDVFAFEVNADTQTVRLDVDVTV